MSVVVSPYRPGTWRRICDVCGTWRVAPSDFISTTHGVWICDRHPGMRPRQELDRLNSRHRAPRVLPAPHPKPLDGRDTWDAEEGRVLSMALDVSPFESVDQTVSGATTGAKNVQAAAWASIYLYSVINENKRPKHWITRAKAQLATLADWLLDNMAGGPRISGSTDNNIKWGAFNRATSPSEEYWSEDSAAAGLALLRAYQVHAAGDYLRGARACAWAVRGFQCGDKLTTFPSSTDSAGASAKHFGAFTHRVRLNGGVYQFDHQFYPSDLIGLEFLSVFKSAIEDETIGSATLTAPFSASRAALVSLAISEVKAFWTTGVQDSSTATVITGLSSTTPKEFYNSYPSDKGTFWAAGSGAWEYQDAGASTGTLVTARGYAIALRAFRSVDGISTQVATIWDWLRSFTSNTTYELTFTATSTLDTETTQLFKGMKGKFDAKIAPSTLLLVRSGSPLVADKKNGSSIYDWAAAGLMTPIQSTRQAAEFRTAKEAANTLQPLTKDPAITSGRYLLLATLGQSGLSYQPATDTSGNRVESVTRSAMVGGFYRYDPQAYTGRFF